MDIKNCKRCRGLFSSYENNICDKCIDKEEEDFVNIQEYLNTNENATLADVARDLNIKIERLRRYITEGRIEVAPTRSLLECQKCGDAINRDRYCQKCSSELKSEIKENSKNFNSNNNDDKSPVQKNAFKFTKKEKEL